MHSAKYKSRDVLNNTHNLGLGKTSTVQNSLSGNINYNPTNQTNSAQKPRHRHNTLKSPLRPAELQKTIQMKQTLATGALGHSSAATPTSLIPSSLVQNFKSNVSNQSSQGSNKGFKSTRNQFLKKKGSLTNRGSKKNSVLQASYQDGNILHAQSGLTVRDQKALFIKSNRTLGTVQNTFGSRERLPTGQLGQNAVPGQNRSSMNIYGHGASGHQAQNMRSTTRAGTTFHALVLPEQQHSSPSMMMHALQNQNTSTRGQAGSQMNRLSQHSGSSGGCNYKTNTFQSATDLRRQQRPNFSNQMLPSSMILSKQKQGSFSAKGDNRMEIEAPDMSPLLRHDDDEPQVDISTLMINLLNMELRRRGITLGPKDKAYDIKTLLGKVTDKILTDKQILACELDLKNQRVVRADAERSRVQKIRAVWKGKDQEGGDINAIREQMDDQIKGHIEKILTHFTKQANFAYKQGVNEILAPFVWLANQNLRSSQLPQHKENNLFIDHHRSAVSFYCLKLFIQNMMPTQFLDDDFVCLQSCFCLMRLLLKYHDPEICYVLSSAMVTPDMYATAWFFTYFANKSDKMSIVIEMWNDLVELGDNKFFFYLTIALIVHNRDLILNSNKSELPIIMASLNFSTRDEMQEIIALAHHLKVNTPVSFLQMREVDILMGRNAEQNFKSLTNEQKVSMHLRLEQMQCLPIQIEELMSNIYPNVIRCPNTDCMHFQRLEVGKQKPSSSEDYIYSQRIQTLMQNGSLNDVLIEYSELYEIGKPGEKGLKMQDMRVNNMVFSPTKQKGPGQLQPQQLGFKGEGDNMKLFKQHSLNSNNKSPFKTMVKQQPIEADASVVPMETETNVKDDDEDPRENQPQQTSLFKAMQKQIQTNLVSNEHYLQRTQGASSLKETAKLLDTCEDCRSSAQLPIINRPSDPNKMRLLVIDCRIDMLMQETALPRTCKVDVENTTDKQTIYKHVKQILSGCTEHDHICLLGLEAQQVPKSYDEAHELGFGASPMGSRHGGSELQSDSISVFHERVLKLIAEILYKEGTKYVSFLPGGFDECHSFIEKQNLVQLSRMCVHELMEPQFLEFLDPHEHSNCYSCFLKEEELKNDAIFLNLSSNNKLSQMKQKLDRTTSGTSPYLIIDDYLESGEKTPKSIQKIQPAKFTISKYNMLTFQLSSSMQVKEESKQSVDQQSFDIFSGFRHWWQDNISSQKFISGFTGLNDLEQQRNLRKSSDHHGDQKQRYFNNESSRDEQVLLKDVTQITRSTIMRNRQPSSVKSSKDLQLMMANLQPSQMSIHIQQPPTQDQDLTQKSMQVQQKRHNPTSKSFAQSALSQIQTNQNNNGRMMPIEQIEEIRDHNVNDDQNYNRDSRLLKIQHAQRNQINQPGKLKSFSRERSSNPKRLIHGLQNDQQVFDYREENHLNNLNEHGVQEINQGLFSPGLTQNSQYYQVSQQQTGATTKQSDTQSKKSNPNAKNRTMNDNQIVISLPVSSSEVSSINMAPSIQGHTRGTQIIVSKKQTQPVLGPKHLERHRATEDDKVQPNRRTGPTNQANSRQPQDESKSAKTTNNQTSRQSNESSDQFRRQISQQSEKVEERKNTQYLNYEMESNNSQPQSRTKKQEKATLQRKPTSSQFQLEERSYYLCNGIQRAQDYSRFVKTVQRIIETDCPATPQDIVIYHVKRLASSHLQQAVQQQQKLNTSDTRGTIKGTEASISTHDKSVKQNVPIFGPIPIKTAQITSIVITQYTTICLCQVNQFIQSRFYMHDLIKITSRKSSAKIITFYFRIPRFGEYDQAYFNDLEREIPIADPDNDKNTKHAILDNYNRNPKIPYQFAYERQNYQEVKMGFEFTTEEEAKDCIERVSVLYKRLKENKKKK